MGEDGTSNRFPSAGLDDVQPITQTPLPGADGAPKAVPDGPLMFGDDLFGNANRNPPPATATGA